MSNTVKPRNARRRSADPLSEARLADRPGCECEHAAGQCPRAARFRVVVLCSAEGCDCAATSHLACGPCADSWVATAERRGAPRLRVMPL